MGIIYHCHSAVSCCFSLRLFANFIQSQRKYLLFIKSTRFRYLLHVASPLAITRARKLSTLFWLASRTTKRGFFHCRWEKQINTSSRCWSGWRGLTKGKAESAFPFQHNRDKWRLINFRSIEQLQLDFLIFQRRQKIHPHSDENVFTYLGAFSRRTFDQYKLVCVSWMVGINSIPLADLFSLPRCEIPRLIL